MKKNKKFIITLGVMLGIALLILLLMFMREKFQKNRCYDLDEEKENYIELVDKCYLLGVINKEKKDYLMEKHKNYGLKNRKTVIGEDNLIKFTTINMRPGNSQYSLYLDSNYCNKEHNYCNGCILSFFNSLSPKDKTVVFSQESDNSGMNFINKAKIDMLNEDFCFNLDCGDYESEDFCTTKTIIDNKK